MGFSGRVGDEGGNVGCEKEERAIRADEFGPSTPIRSSAHFYLHNFMIHFSHLSSLSSRSISDQGWVYLFTKGTLVAWKQKLPRRVSPSFAVACHPPVAPANSGPSFWRNFLLLFCPLTSIIDIPAPFPRTNSSLPQLIMTDARQETSFLPTFSCFNIAVRATRAFIYFYVTYLASETILSLFVLVVS